jgi:hypothetical protein
MWFEMAQEMKHCSSEVNKLALEKGWYESCGYLIRSRTFLQNVPKVMRKKKGITPLHQPKSRELSNAARDEILSSPVLLE